MTERGGDYYNIHGSVSGGGNGAHPNPNFDQGWYGGFQGEKIDGGFGGNGGWGHAAPAAAMVGRGDGDYYSTHGGVSGGGNSAYPNPHLNQGWYGGGQVEKLDEGCVEGTGGWGHAAPAAAWGGDYYGMHGGVSGGGVSGGGVSGGGNSAHLSPQLNQGWYGGNKSENANSRTGYATEENSVAVTVQCDKKKVATKENSVTVQCEKKKVATKDNSVSAQCKKRKVAPKDNIASAQCKKKKADTKENSAAVQCKGKKVDADLFKNMTLQEKKDAVKILKRMIEQEERLVKMKEGIQANAKRQTKKPDMLTYKHDAPSKENGPGDDFSQEKLIDELIRGARYNKRRGWRRQELGIDSDVERRTCGRGLQLTPNERQQFYREVLLLEEYCKRKGCFGKNQYGNTRGKDGKFIKRQQKHSPLTLTYLEWAWGLGNIYVCRLKKKMKESESVVKASLAIEEETKKKMKESELVVKASLATEEDTKKKMQESESVIKTSLMTKEDTKTKMKESESVVKTSLMTEEDTDNARISLAKTKCPHVDSEIADIPQDLHSS